MGTIVKKKVHAASRSGSSPCLARDTHLSTMGREAGAGVGVRLYWEARELRSTQHEKRPWVAQLKSTGGSVDLSVDLSVDFSRKLAFLLACSNLP